MTSELTINVQPDSIQIAITEDHNLVEYQKDAQEVTFAVGNLYLGRVKKLMPGLNACFVDWVREGGIPALSGFGATVRVIEEIRQAGACQPQETGTVQQSPASSV